MDLLATVRKEGSRGGQTDFKWSDVQNSTRREHYLGHSIMAPVGRWAKGRDLSWYAKGDASNADGEDPAEKAARERREEIKRVKEAEEDALARALGLPVPDRNNANLEPVSEKRQADKTIAGSSKVDGNVANSLGYEKEASGTQDFHNRKPPSNAEEQDKELQYALREHRRRQHHHGRDTSARSPNRERHRHRRDRDHRDRDRDYRHARHRSRSRERHRTRRSRSKSPTHHRESYRKRSRSFSPRHSRKSNSERR